MGANIRGDSIQRKKELTYELGALELMEEFGLLSRSQYARKSQVQKWLMEIYEEEEKNTGSVDQVRDGYSRVMRIRLISIRLRMGGREKIQCIL